MGFFPMHYGSISVMFGAGLLMLWLLVAGYKIRDLPARAILCLTGHLRARPDPWLEAALRKALTEFDRELTVIMHDKGNPVRPARPVPPRGPESPPGQSDGILARCGGAAGLQLAGGYRPAAAA